MNALKIISLTATAFVACTAAPFAQASTEANAADPHVAMAQELQQKAAVANQKAAAHEVMARSGGSPKAATGGMGRHCEKLIAQYRAEAAKYSAQAAEHQQHAGAATLTREQHLALAEEFDAKAAAANEKVAAHEAMARASGSPKGSRQAMENHCDQLVSQYKAEAADYSAKAAEHRLAAK
jgi:hypothetical protein